MISLISWLLDESGHVSGGVSVLLKVTYRATVAYRLSRDASLGFVHSPVAFRPAGESRGGSRGGTPAFPDGLEGTG